MFTGNDRFNEYQLLIELYELTLGVLNEINYADYYITMNLNCILISI